MHDEHLQKFWDRVEKRGPDECWPWTGSRLPAGYGRFGPRHGLRLYAHRASWEIASGRPIPPGMVVCHRCDNPPCVNPAHLFVGEHADNVADKVRKGRASGGSLPGSRNPYARLTRDDVIAMRRDHSAGMDAKQVAEKHGVSHAHAWRIVTRRSWRHL